MENQGYKGSLTENSKKCEKWSRLKVSGMDITKGAVIRIEDYLYQVKRRIHKKSLGLWVLYVEEYKPIVIRKSL